MPGCFHALLINRISICAGSQQLLHQFVKPGPACHHERRNSGLIAGIDGSPMLQQIGDHGSLIITHSKV